MYRVKPTNGKNVRFVVMNNVFATNLQLHERYDLKGSTQGRYATAAEKQKPNVILKDLDFQGSVHLGNIKTKLLHEQIERDCKVYIISFPCNSLVFGDDEYYGLFYDFGCS